MQSVAARFWSKVDIGAPGECWEWGGGQQRGYGRFRLPKKTVYAYRFAYELLVGPVPEGLQLDHLCRNRLCVNPSHLEPVDNRTNVLRGQTVVAANAAKTHCPAGHPYDAVNKSGARICRRCAVQRTLRYRARRAAA